MSEPKLVDDCFRPNQKLLGHAEAVRQLKSRVSAITGVEAVATHDAVGRILASGVTAEHPVPAHTNAAVDGFAFAARELAGTLEKLLPVSGRAAAGHPLKSTPPAGSAVRILTGAVLPDGLDTVAMQEDCAIEIAADGTEYVKIPTGLKPGANVRKAGEDVPAGTQLYSAGHLIRPQDLAALASIGFASISCRKKLEVALVSTGDEVIRAGTRPLRSGEVYDANMPMLTGLATLAGARVTDLGVWPDKAEEVKSRLAEAASKFDVILTSGGASKGSEDYMAVSIDSLGTRHFWEIAVKPGRPMMLGQIGNTPVIGLPGNPVAVFVCFLMYVFPMLRALSGAPWPEPRRLMLPSAFAFPKRKVGRREFWRGMIVETPKGLAVDKFARDGSGLISGLRAADGLIECPENVAAVVPGDMVAFIPFTEFGILGR
jgi:molybdopterin molybdotransferase